MRLKIEEEDGPTRRGDQVDGAAGGHPDPGSSRVGAPEGDFDEPEEGRAARLMCSPCDPTAGDVILHKLNHHASLPNSGNLHYLKNNGDSQSLIRKFADLIYKVEPERFDCRISKCNFAPPQNSTPPLKEEDSTDVLPRFFLSKKFVGLEMMLGCRFTTIGARSSLYLIGNI